MLLHAGFDFLARLLTAAATPLPVGDLSLQVTASLGETFYPQVQGLRQINCCAKPIR